MKRSNSTVCILAACGVIVAMCLPAACRSTDPAPDSRDHEGTNSRSGELAEVAALIDRAEKALRTNGSDTSAILSDPRFLTAHGWPRFRELIKAHVRGSNITMATPQEPGKRLRVRMRVVEADGSPSAGALVYFYHTDAKGDYGPNDANVPLAGSDNEYARLFCYALTDSDGTIVVHTIRPGGYPDGSDAEHIHIRITWPARRSAGAALCFDDDLRLTREMRAEAARERVVICPVTTDARGQQSIDATIKLD